MRSMIDLRLGAPKLSFPVADMEVLRRRRVSVRTLSAVEHDAGLGEASGSRAEITFAEPEVSAAGSSGMALGLVEPFFVVLAEL